ncbi:hypothetical protein [Sinimarinibacterium flocculans]|uniref:hypothetical protein n=1 Tax=Sinimarinibacterium flocculans TaxID=985250 RepID=UPI0024937D84|nr:hypothetical protein [Sinimarinibacterium flocculans]
MQLPESATEAVANGVELLDARVPDWRERIDTDTLNLADFRNCVLGQLGGYTVLRDEWDMSIREAVACGFEASIYFDYDTETDADDTYGYLDLTEAWKQELDA